MNSEEKRLLKLLQDKSDSLLISEDGGIALDLNKTKVVDRILERMRSLKNIKGKS